MFNSFRSVCLISSPIRSYTYTLLCEQPLTGYLLKVLCGVCGYHTPFPVLMNMSVRFPIHSCNERDGRQHPCSSAWYALLCLSLLTLYTPPLWLGGIGFANKLFNNVFIYIKKDVSLTGFCTQAGLGGCLHVKSWLFRVSAHMTLQHLVT